MIRVQNLRFGYADQGNIFDDFSLTINDGEAWTLIGPSGCGKTTLLFLLAGLKKPLAGLISVAGEVIHRPRPLTGLVLQDHGLLPWSTVLDNAALGLTIRSFYGPDGKHSPAGLRQDKKKDRQRVDYWLRWLGIDQLQHLYPAQLSRGQRQRAAIARTLVMEPDLLLMDEPFSALDAPIREELQGVMNNLHRQSGLTSVTVTHDIEEALVLGEKILVLNRRCNSQPTIIENSLYGDPERRTEKDFLDRCGQLRELLGVAGDGGK